MKVWLIENGRWDDRYVVGIAASLDAAEKYIREKCGPSTEGGIWTAKWGALVNNGVGEATLAGRFKITRQDNTTSGYKDEWDITKWDVAE